MKHIVLIGAGKSASFLINYLKDLTLEKNWAVTVADNDISLVKQKVGNHPKVKSLQLDIVNEIARKELIEKADVVISMMPPHLHYLIALDCIEFSKHLLTASYIDENIKKLQTQIEEKQLLFLCEMGLDPGIDHMSAMQMIDNIHRKGGLITSFKSHCGGLIAPESDDNPWHYKISWNPRNIVMAGKAGSKFKMNNQIVQFPYEKIFNDCKIVQVSEQEKYAYYPNRDSLSYMPLYHLEQTPTFIRTTLRHPEFIFGWKQIVDLQLTNEEKFYQTDGMSIENFFKLHFDKYGFNDWLHHLLNNTLNATNESITKKAERKEPRDPIEFDADEAIMMVSKTGELNTIQRDEIKEEKFIDVSQKIYETNLIIKQLFFLGLADQTLINKGLCSAAEVLQFIIEQKWELKPNDQDMIVMIHEIEYILNSKLENAKSILKVIGENNLLTAMSKTVGLPLGIAAKLLLEDKIKMRGLHIPIDASIYTLVLKELAYHGIKFQEE
jgi:saccharopine dehydrogenase-like NADP-dependent oxidoreductase